jgi:hypothetical protein
MDAHGETATLLNPNRKYTKSTEKREKGYF